MLSSFLSDKAIPLLMRQTNETRLNECRVFNEEGRLVLPLMVLCAAEASPYLVPQFMTDVLRRLSLIQWNRDLALTATPFMRPPRY